jgi:hypothetical protein
MKTARVLVALALLVVAVLLTNGTAARRVPTVAGHQHGIGMVIAGTTDPGWPTRNSSQS